MTMLGLPASVISSPAFPPPMPNRRNADQKPHLHVARLKGIGVLSREDAINFSCSGPSPGPAASFATCVKTSPTWPIRTEFKVICSNGCDCFARYLVRMQEMLESIKLIEQAVENLPSGPINVDAEGRAIVPGKEEVYQSIEGLIRHFEVIIPNRGFVAPNEEIYAANETANGELGYYIVGNGTIKAYRARHASAVFHPLCHLSPFDQRPHLERHRRRVGKSQHHRCGAGPISALSEKTRERIQAEFAKYPNKRAATLPALHIVQDEHRQVSTEALQEVAQLLELHPAEVNDTLSFYGFFRNESDPLGKHRRWICRSLSCALRGGEELLGPGIGTLARKTRADNGRRQNHA